MYSITERYTGPSVTARRTGKCPTCGKRVTRSRTFSATVNPFNRNGETGLPKTWAEVDADVRKKADAWAPALSEFEHFKCKDATAGYTTE